jgi:signal transduction histidine kinase
LNDRGDEVGEPSTEGRRVAHEQGAARTIRVLLVGDNGEDLRRLAEMLGGIREARLQLVAAESFEAASRSLRQHQPEALLVDLGPSGPREIDALKTLRAQVEAIPIVALTGVEDVSQEVLQHGALDCLVKSRLTPELLLRSIRYAIERLRAEKALRRSQDRFAELKEAEEQQQSLQRMIQRAASEWTMTVDAVELPIVLLNFDGRIRRLNRAARDLAGKEYHDLVEQPIAALGSGEPWSTAASIARSFRRNNETIVRQIRDEITERTWELSMRYFFDAVADEPRITIVARDVSRVVELQDTLRQTEMMSALGSLVAGVAHQIRNPLFSVTATLDAFEARFRDRDDFQRYVAVMRVELKRLGQLTQDLMEYGKPPQAQFRPSSIQEILAEAIHACSAMAGQLGVSIHEAIQGPLPLVQTDRSRLEQAFQNLIENALQHSSQGGTISVEARQLRAAGQAWIECVIRDSGSGIREEDLPRIFDPFFSRRRGGTGLGLSIVRRIVEEHKGRISVYNDPGGGAVAAIKLPCLGA